MRFATVAAMTEDAVAESVEMIIAAARAAYKDAPYRVDESQLRPLIMNHLAAAEQRGREAALSGGGPIAINQGANATAYGVDPANLRSIDD